MSRGISSRLSLTVCLALLSAGAAAAQPGARPLPAPKSQDEKMQWFRQAKFGLFIHWGLYAIPAGEWNGQPDLTARDAESLRHRPNAQPREEDSRRALGPQPKATTQFTVIPFQQRSVPSS